MGLLLGFSQSRYTNYKDCLSLLVHLNQQLVVFCPLVDFRERLELCLMQFYTSFATNLQASHPR